MKRMHFMTGETNSSGQLVLTLVEPGFDDKQSAAKGAKSLEPGTYMLVSFDSPDPLVVAPPPAATRNVVKFGKPFVERQKSNKPAKVKEPGSAKIKK